MEISHILDRVESFNATLVAVTKTRSIEEMNDVLKYGVKNIGENTIQEAQRKFPYLQYECKKHFIGHLQSNKVKDVVKLFDVIHSIDSEKLYLKLLQEAKKNNKKIDILFQINLSQEPQKYGFSEQTFERFIAKNSSLISEESYFLEPIGLMTMACDLQHGEKKVRSIFRKAKELSKQYKDCIGNEISMGMSQDYDIALEEGSTIVRIGSAIWS